MPRVRIADRAKPWVATLLVAWLAGAFSAPAQGGDLTAVLRNAIDLVCKAPQADLDQLAAQNGAAAIEHTDIVVRGVTIGWRRRLALQDGNELRIERIAPRGRVRRISAEYRAASNDGLRPELVAFTGPDCKIRAGRRLIYTQAEATAVALEELDETLASTGKTEPLNPPVPTGKDPGGVLVALVDAGVNYLLPEINARLARDERGKILGYDYWDLDDRPFDANPARSLFFPQRHGTRIASIVLRETPEARLVPYRYPRPEMSRMADLVRDATAKGVIIVSLSMGSNKAEYWQAFADEARTHPEMLFVVSAGNNGRDIDAHPVYPAALPLENMITVTSAEATGELARGSNRGRQSVDLLVPAENLISTGFNGQQIRVSGSSYAAPRIAALAARLLTRNPKWHAPELKAAIFARALAPVDTQRALVSQGFIPDPSKAETRAVVQRSTKLERLNHHILTFDALYTGGIEDRRYTHTFHPTFAYFEKTAWSFEKLRPTTAQAAMILSQCGVFIPRIEVHELRGPDIFRYFRDSTAKELVHRLPLAKPTVYFVRDTLQKDAYDAEAIGKGNSRSRPSLIYTAWITEGIRDPGISLAHELVHILMDSGRHVDLPGNLMRADTSPENAELTEAQCERIKGTGVRNGLLNPLLASPSKWGR